MQTLAKLPVKTVEFLHGEPVIKWKKQEVKQSIIQQELHKSHEDKEEEQNAGKELVGTAANSTKVLSSGKVVGKPITNHAKKEWMQARMNKYQRDNRGHITKDKQGKEDDKGKGKAKFEEVVTKNKFNALEVEEVHHPTLQITEGEGEDHGNAPEGVQELVKANSIVPTDQRTDDGANKESTIDWVHRRFGTSKEELRQLNVTINQSCHEIPSQTYAENQSGSSQLSLSKKKGNGTVKPSKTGEILAFIEGVPVYALEKGLDEGVHMKVRKDTVRSDQQTGHGKEGDGIVISGQAAIVTPGLGSVYEMKFKMMQVVVSSIEQNKGNEHSKEQLEQAIVPRATGK
ncbi:hypothetical protein A4A49_03443 [Nicotiana attenuata]|uniref:Uncharacterized protein n=1 Tax=Nicotiana attenuata TaxID=49451 RepID=A0A1J6J7Y4_NICAT|nr:hypothetical protein A4A49_03443 [Nicotiana attenuata]